MPAHSSDPRDAASASLEFNRDTVPTLRMGPTARRRSSQWWQVEAVRKGEPVVNYTEKLRRLALNDPGLHERAAAGELRSVELEPTTLSLVQLAALIAVGGAVPSYGELTDAAVGSGVTVAEIVDVLVAVIPIVGLPCVVESAPKLAMALGYDTNEAFEPDALP